MFTLQLLPSRPLTPSFTGPGLVLRLTTWMVGATTALPGVRPSTFLGLHPARAYGALGTLLLPREESGSQFSPI